MPEEKYDAKEATPSGDKKPRKKGEMPASDPKPAEEKRGEPDVPLKSYPPPDEQHGLYPQAEVKREKPFETLQPGEEEKEEDDAPRKSPNRRKLDPELKAMDEVCAVLEVLDAATRLRVLNWANQKFSPAANATRVKPTLDPDEDVEFVDPKPW